MSRATTSRCYMRAPKTAPTQGGAEDLPSLASWCSDLAAVAVGFGPAPALGVDRVYKVGLDWHALRIASIAGCQK
jgi:hypothetical protein